jgi:hypothetical protein
MDFSVMNITTIELKKLTASVGMTLTNGETFSKEVYLGINDSADNWYEITDEEAEEKIKELEVITDNVLFE